MSNSQAFALPDGYRRQHRVAPWWVGYLLLSPVRHWFQNPRRILRPHVKPGQTVLEVGPGMGFFTLPLAELVSADGRVIGVDCQERMLETLQRRAGRRGLADRIETRGCRDHTLQIADLDQRVDLVLAFNVVHEARIPSAWSARWPAACARAGGSFSPNRAGT